MTFEARETSRTQGEPVTLFEFIYGGTIDDDPGVRDSYTYTNAENAVTFGSLVYDPVPVQVGEIRSNGDLDKAPLSIRLPRDTDLASKFIVYPPAQVVQVVVRQGHAGDPDTDFKVVWVGRVLGGGREDDEFVLTCESVASQLRRPGLRRHYQFGCPHALYGDQCRASEAAATVSATVSSLGGTSITLASGWEGGFAQAKFLEGVVKWTNDDGGTEIRKIMSISGDTLTLGGFLRDLVASAAVSVVLGCNHQMTDCGALHNNIQNFGGCPWIPTKNPVGYRNLYY